LAYIAGVHVVVESPEFAADAKAAGLVDEDVQRIIDHLARRPEAGAVIPGTGGARKVRFAGRGKGKSGGYRVITFYSGATLPVFLLTVSARARKST
jgi:mRNA-degrading endonuclease RelE of RelBE toxin-antitoxin system